MENLLEGIDKAIAGMKKMSHVNEDALTGLKRVEIRDSGRKTDPSGMVPKNSAIKMSASDIIGWFSNKYNPAAGWVVCRLSSFDKGWLGSNAKDAFRVFTNKGTSIVKFDLRKGTYAFLDNAYYEETDSIRFEKKSAYKVFVIDDIKYLKSEFGISI